MGGSLRERDDLQKFSGDDRRVNQRGQGNGGEMNFVSALARDGKRRAKLPSLRKFQAGGVVDIVERVALGIKQNLVPADDRQLVGGGRTGGESAFEGRGREEVEIGGDFVHARRNVDVDGKAIERVAAPLQDFAVSAEKQAGEIDDWAVRRVLAGNPFRVIECEVAGSGRNLQSRVENLAWGVGGIDGDGDGGWVCRRCRSPSRNRQHRDASQPPAS